MNKEIALASLLLVILIGSLCFVLYSFFSEPHPHVEVGVYYYPWYPSHWNGTAPPDDRKAWTVVDTPVLGFYSSNDTATIRQHLEWLEELGIDFLIVSWWGPNSTEDYSAKTLFSVVRQDNYSINIALMVEAYDWNGTYDFKAIYDYVEDTYASPYEDVYMRLNDHPLVCFYNDLNMTENQTQRNAIYSDDRFAARIVGHSTYVDWWFAIPCNVSSLRTPPLSRKDGMVCVEPRYGDRYLGRDKNSTFGVDFSEGLYDEQWSEALRLAREGKADYVAIYSWNEYHERSQIEPCYDKTSDYADDPYFLFNRTRQHIKDLKAMPEFPLSLVLLLSLATVTVSAVIFFRKRRAANRMPG